MTLNKSKGNMYPWVTHTWNPIRGYCPHQCTYCYMKGFNVGEFRLDEKALKDNLGERRIIFVGSSTDMWAEDVPQEWIEKVLSKLSFGPRTNKYLFQSKNPDRFYEFRKIGLPHYAIYGTTIETTDVGLSLRLSRAPDIYVRYIDFVDLNLPAKMVSIEPIMDFHLERMVRWMKEIQPVFISIGADSKGHKLPEPPASKVKELIQELEKFTEVKIKKNLSRLLR